MIPLLVHTPGEPAGIGPELIIRLAQNASPDCRVVIADGAMLRHTAEHLGLPLELIPFEGERHATPAGKLWHCPQKQALTVSWGQPSSANASYLLDCLRQAITLAEQSTAAMITGPLHKATINQAGISFSGHTEFIAQVCAAPNTPTAPVMMLTSGDLRVALATTHLPLRAVADAITRESLQHILDVLERELIERFGIAQPRIQVCGLNPHAGEGGHLGREEIDTLQPVIEQWNSNTQRRARLIGPVPADTAFTPDKLQQCDAVLAMYHDQGLPTLKHIGFGDAVNVTLGLPIIRTSVDHGTAFDIAGLGIADLGSLRAAENLARQLAGQNAEQQPKHKNGPAHEHE